MVDYVAPVSDMAFVLREVLDFPGVQKRHPELTEEFVEAILGEAGKFATDIFGPLNRVGDAEGVRLQDDEVVLPSGFAEAYSRFVDNGWQGLAQPVEYGGQGLPFVLHMAVSEMWNSACTSLALCPLLTSGAIEALTSHASDELKDRYLPKLVTGQWSATMNLTEPHAGSDLSSLRTRADPEGDHYRIRGQKVFITWGEHPMAENIVHIVLAPMVDAPPGVKGLSLFLVPKYLVNADGEIGVRNDLKAIGVEKKLGIHGSPTCAMSFGEADGAIGYLIGEPGQGLACMFTLMNHARLEVGLQAVALSERAFQDALAYARERVQGVDAATGAPAKIIAHADVQRMLMLMMSLTQAMRAMAYEGAVSYDARHRADTREQRQLHEQRFGLLTPIVKAWSTELVNEITSLAIQVHGGIGFIEETGVAQHYRDARITAIYEGTNGIQANDLVSRKLIRDQGAGINSLLEDIATTIDEMAEDKALSGFGSALAPAAQALKSITSLILDRADEDPHFVGRVAFNFLMMMGYICGAWYMARSAQAAIGQLGAGKGDVGFYQRKLTAARFYMTQVLPRYQGYETAIRSGEDVGARLDVESFG